MQFENPQPTELEWYNKARVKAESFVLYIDPSLRVEVVPATIRPKNKEPYSTLALGFSSSSDPRLNWTMEIELSDRYIDERLESLVRQIYQERVEELK